MHNLHTFSQILRVVANFLAPLRLMSMSAYFGIFLDVAMMYLNKKNLQRFYANVFMLCVVFLTLYYQNLESVSVATAFCSGHRSTK